MSGPPAPVPGFSSHDDPTLKGGLGAHEDTRRVAVPSHAPIPGPSFDAGKGTPEADARVGMKLGPYVLGRALARGGMGVVYLAEDPGLRRKVAIKLMLKEALADEDAARRFQREARATGSLSHPNIASVFMVGSADDGSPFLAMEYLDGGSVLDLIRNRTPVPYARAADLMAQAAEGLRGAFKAGIIHRDIKPGNMMLSSDGALKIVDFGLAKAKFDDTYRTVEGTVLGTPKYMSPEQGQGRQLDFRSDIYSLGASFYHLLTGRPPFEADSSVQIMFKHATAPLVPMRSIVPTVPIEWDNVVARTMRKEAGDRYQDYDDLITDLRSLKLQTMAREQGPIIGSDGTQNPVRDTRSSTSLSMLPGPPSLEVSRLSSTNAGSVSADRILIAAGEPPSMPLAYKLSFAIVAAIVLLGSMYLALKASHGDESDDTDSATVVTGQGLSALLGEIVSESGKNAKKFPPNSDYVSYIATVRILESLDSALQTYKLSHDDAGPSGLGVLVTEGLVSAQLDVDANGDPLDGWRQRLTYMPGNQEIRSPGFDRVAYSSDDLFIAESSSIEIPREYLALEEAEKKRRVFHGD